MRKILLVLTCIVCRAAPALADEIDYPAKPAVGSTDEAAQRFLYRPDHIPAGTLSKDYDLNFASSASYVPDAAATNGSFNLEVAPTQAPVVLGGELDANAMGKTGSSYSGTGYVGFAPEALKRETMEVGFYGFLNRSSVFSGSGKATLVLRPRPFTVRAFFGPRFTSAGVGYTSGISMGYSLRIVDGHMLSFSGSLANSAPTFSTANASSVGASLCYQLRNFRLSVSYGASVSNLSAYAVSSGIGYAL